MPLIGRIHQHLRVCGSTNDEVIARARAGASEGLVITADLQTAGRGRFGRRWVSPQGKGLHFSVLLQPPLPSSSTPLVMLTALAAAEAMEGVAPVTAGIKWPNDLMVGGRKAGGILAEVIGYSPADEKFGVSPSYVLGIGINVNLQASDFPGEVRDFATSLTIESGTPCDRELLTSKLIERLDAWYLQYLSSGVGTIFPAFVARDVTLGRTVRISGAGPVVEGIAESIGMGGELTVRTTSGERSVFVAGEVTLREANSASLTERCSG